MAPANDHLRPLADDIPAEPDPRAAGELEADSGRFGGGTGESGDEARRFEEDEGGARPPGERPEPAEPVGHHGRSGDGVRAG